MNLSLRPCRYPNPGTKLTHSAYATVLLWIVRYARSPLPSCFSMMENSSAVKRAGFNIDQDTPANAHYGGAAPVWFAAVQNQLGI